MSRTVLALLAASFVFPATASDLLGGESLSASVDTSAHSYDLIDSNSDSDMMAATSFAGLPIAVSSVADSQAGPGSGSASLSGTRFLNGVTATGFTVASASANSDGGSDGSAVSEFLFSFTLGSSADYVLDWEFAGGGLLVTGFSELSLVGPGNVELFAQDHGTFGTISGQALGTLGSGTYTLHAISMSFATGSGSGSEGADASFNIGFSVVPAPGAAALFGMAGVMGVRRRRFVA